MKITLECNVYLYMLYELLGQKRDSRRGAGNAEQMDSKGNSTRLGVRTPWELL
ncbi:hypothetical protein KJ854_05510 [Patescibacteria group bacterium]|nr:hypothetical protein [Patescibacteria group bacterium]